MRPSGIRPNQRNNDAGGVIVGADAEDAKWFGARIELAARVVKNTQGVSREIPPGRGWGLGYVTTYGVG